MASFPEPSSRSKSEPLSCGWPSPVPSRTWVISSSEGDEFVHPIHGANCQKFLGHDSGTKIGWYVYNPQTVDEIISQRQSNTSLYHLIDGLGSVYSLINTTQEEVASYSYDAFGIARKENTQNDISNRWLFTGREYDSESGLLYNRARYYNPNLGNWLTDDPIRVQAQSNRSIALKPRELDTQNSWRFYVTNNPVSGIDPSGLWGEGPHTMLTEYALPYYNWPIEYWTTMVDENNGVDARELLKYPDLRGSQFEGYKHALVNQRLVRDDRMPFGVAVVTDDIETTYRWTNTWIFNNIYWAHKNRCVDNPMQYRIGGRESAKYIGRALHTMQDGARHRFRTFMRHHWDLWILKRFHEDCFDCEDYFFSELDTHRLLFVYVNDFNIAWASVRHSYTTER